MALLLTVILGALALLPTAAPAAGPAAVGWSWDAYVGHDSFTHTYALATSDTSETVSETRVLVGCERRSAPGARASWRLRLEGSAGTDLWREQLEADWRRRDADGGTRARLNLRASGRQYRSGTDYTQSSDQAEARLDAQFTALARERHELYLQGWGAAAAFDRPSALEQDLREAGAGLGLRSRGDGEAAWLVSVRHARRAYPDSAAIDRHSWSGEVDLARPLGEAGTCRLYARSERRLAADPQVRPDAWLHWLDASVQAPTAVGEIVCEAQTERWDYAAEGEVYVDSRRLAGFAGLRRGDVLGVQWLAGLAGEDFASGAGAESYTQAGLRVGLESYGTRLAGTCTVEYGRRDYPAQATTDGEVAWTDFNYWRLWLLADFRLSSHLALSALGTWEPERHAEPQDDVSLGFASLRLAWRP